MSNALTLFDSPKLTVPKHVASFFAEESNIADRVTVPSLSYEGKVWTVSLNGEKTRLTRRDDDGDEVPVSVMRVVVLDYAKRRGRAYYEGAYDPAKAGAPLCWSEDGIKPHERVAEPKASACDSCPLAVKGSKVTEQGKAIAACSQHRMLVVVPAGKVDGEPLRMKIAITSDWDKNEDLAKEGWFGFQNYTDFLRTKGVQHTAALVTKMKFDPSVPYPKVIFSPDRWLEDDELTRVAPTVKSDKVKQLLAGTWTPAGVDGTKMDADEDEAPAPAPKPVAKPAPKPVAAVEDEDEAPAPKPAAKPVKVQVALDDEDEAPKPVKVKAKVVKDEDEAPAPKVAKEEPKPAKAADLPGDVADLLADWDND